MSQLKAGHRFRFDTDPALAPTSTRTVQWLVLSSGPTCEVKIFSGRKKPDGYLKCDCLQGGLPGSLLVVPMTPGASYFLSLPGQTKWLIRPDLLERGWHLSLEHSDGAEENLGLFELPHSAALAVAEFRTGLLQWDRLPLNDAGGLAPVWSRNFHDLGHWTRTD